MSHEQHNVNFGEDQYNADEQHFDYRQYQYFNVVAGGRRCPEHADPPGCGGPLKKLEVVWQENNLKGKPLNERGRRSRPPRNPGPFTEEPPRPPVIARPPEPTPPPPAPPPPPNPIKRAMLKALPWGCLALICACGVSDCSSFISGTMPSRTFSPLWSSLALLVAIGVFGLGTWHYKLRGKAAVERVRQAAADNELQYQRAMALHQASLDYIDTRVVRDQRHHETDIAQYRERKEAHDKKHREHREAMRVWIDAWVCTACGRGWHNSPPVGHDAFDERPPA